MLTINGKSSKPENKKTVLTMEIDINRRKPRHIQIEKKIWYNSVILWYPLWVYFPGGLFDWPMLRPIQPKNGNSGCKEETGKHRTGLSNRGEKLHWKNKKKKEKKKKRKKLR